MRNVNRSLRESDPALLPVLARVWQVDIEDLTDDGEIIDAVSSAMLKPDQTERVWLTLTDKQRGALFTLIGSKAKMPLRMFEGMFGEIRKMGVAQIERERPDQHPATLAEGLYYKGLIAQGFEAGKAGAIPVVYVPDDLLGVLPVQKTAYETLDEEEFDSQPIEIEVEAVAEARGVRNADTSVVDDLTTLLAYLQLHNPALEIDARMQMLSDYRLAQADRAALAPFLLTQGDERITFLLGLALGADLIEVQSGHAQPKRAEARRWLAASRPDQVRRLVEAWAGSLVYRDLWHVPGLLPQVGGTLDSYNPAVIREAVFGFLSDLVPAQTWWSIESYIEAVKVSDPDFQRPDGNYDSWYIQNEAGETLQGIESWDAIEGALLEFYIMGPMHWLGLLDVGEDAARLTVYGRAFLGKGAWPNPPEPQDKITVRDDGTLLVSRKVTRIDRFQVARFTTWGAAGDPYTYKLDARGIAQGAKQGINPGHIAAFITKALNDAPLPLPIAKLLDNWRTGPATSVSLERLLVLRTTAPETMDKIWEAPALRRYLGARLGEMAVIVRADQWEALRDALGEEGIQVDVSG